MAASGDDDSTDTVYCRTVDGTDEYAYVAEDHGDAVVLWLYTRAAGFREIRKVPRSEFQSGDWERIEALPDAVLEQVSGDEVPYEPT